MSKSPRFPVGTFQLFFLLTYIDKRNGRLFHTTSPTYFRDYEFQGIEVKELRCQSQHDVPIEFVDNKTGQGFIFVDDENREYHNQYPIASYEQLSDNDDRMVVSNFKPYRRFRLMTCLLDDTHRFFKEHPDSEMKPHADEIMALFEQYLTDNGYASRQQEIWEQAPDITRTVILETPEKMLVNGLRAKGFKRTVYEDQVIDGETYVSFRKDMPLKDLPAMCKELDFDISDAGDLKVAFEIEQSGAHMQYCLLSDKHDEWRKLENPASNANKALLYSFLELMEPSITENA